MRKSSIESISSVEMRENPIWRFANRPRSNETELTPVKKLPCKDLKGRLVAAQVTLADGTTVWSFLGNIDTTNARLTEHFITISVENNGKWFHLARYHDFDYEDRSPARLAAFLERDVESVFPIHYDIRAFVLGESDALKGTIELEPQERLTRAEIIAMAVP
ncbi:MAG: hypothetical protein KF752_19930 [Pirellulaceae bacterium]|nr:hypothetical protein [Pirellulaceae bacterium]